MIRAALIFLAILSPFFFPWQVAFGIGIVAAFSFPPIIILNGCLLDLLYFNGAGLPAFTFFSFIAAAIAYFVHQFIKTRIIL
jgi:hypothetical protein